MRAVGWVRVLLMGTVNGRRLTALAAGMPLRHVEPVRGGVELDVRAGDLNALRHALRGAGVRMRILRRYGMARVRRVARRRGTLVLAAIIASLLLGGLSQTVLSVQVVGAKDAVQEQEMLTLIRECGVKAGVWAGSVDRDGAAEQVLARFSGLTYATVRRRGVTMELYVVQAEYAPEVYDPNAAVDVVAVTGGLVTRVVTLSGEALVQPGDTVVSGQVLIRGTERMPHARGAVTARVWTVGRGEAQMRTQTVTRTGRQMVQTYIRIGDWQFPQARETGFAQQETKEERTLLLDGLFYPVEVIRCVHCEVIYESETRKIASVKDECGARALTNALLELKNGACVVDKRVEYSMIEDGKLYAVVTLESVMQIGKEVGKSAAYTSSAEE